MGGSRDSDLPDWSYRGTRGFKYPNNIIAKTLRAKPFGWGGVFKSEEEVVRFMEERGAKITGVTVDPDPNDYLSNVLCKNYLEDFAELMTRSVPASGNLKKHYDEQIVKHCGFMINGIYGKNNVEK